jgi:hypothetical protein
MLFALLLGVTPASAGPPEEASGHWTYVPDFTSFSVRTAGNTTFIEGTEVSTFTGTLTGESNDEFFVACHQKGPESFMNYVKITIEFTGEVDDRAGGLTIKATGKQDSTTCDPSGAIWSGKWVIINGTGDLADLHGQGEWTGPSFDLDYTGQVHFS